jgi:hypothetical protein
MSDRERGLAQVTAIGARTDGFPYEASNEQLLDPRVNLEFAARKVARLRERLTFLDRDYQQLAAKVAALERERTGQPAWTEPATPSAAAPSPPGSAGSSQTAQPFGGAQTVELPPIVVRKDQSGMGLPVRGQVIEVNEAHRFVVVDKGANDGVAIGMIFDILRAGARVAQAVAVRVRPQLAACDLVTSQSPEFPRVGDVAIQRNP